MTGRAQEGEVQVTLPKLGESIHSARILKWLKSEGEEVRRDEPLLEVSTDKVASEIPAPVAGVVGKILRTEGEECLVGDPLCFLRSLCQAKEKSFFSPAVLRLLEEKGITLDKIKEIRGSGEGGRVTKHDIEAFALDSPEIVPLTFVRKAIAENMERSHREIPLAHLITKVDVTDLLQEIAREKPAFQEKWGSKLTITSYIAYALSRALEKFPLLNGRFTKEGVRLQENVGLGIAVYAHKELFVPVLRNAEKLHLPEIAIQIATLSRKALEGSLVAADTECGTITLSNFGMSGIEIGLPLIRSPETAILAVGAIEKRVEVLPDDSYGVRSVMHCTLGFDHRVLDGMLAAEFLQTFKKILRIPVSPK